MRKAEKEFALLFFIVGMFIGAGIAMGGVYVQLPELKTAICLPAKVKECKKCHDSSECL